MTRTTPHQITQMKALRKTGLSYGDIAEELKMSRGIVYHYLKGQQERKQQNLTSCMLQFGFELPVWGR